MWNVAIKVVCHLHHSVIRHVQYYHHVCTGQFKQSPLYFKGILLQKGIITYRVSTACPGDIVHTYSENTEITMILYTQQVFISSEEH